MAFGEKGWVDYCLRMIMNITDDKGTYKYLIVRIIITSLSSYAANHLENRFKFEQRDLQ